MCKARLSTRGKQIIAPDSTHMIPLAGQDVDEQKIVNTVVNAIQEVCDAVRTGPSPKG